MKRLFIYNKFWSDKKLYYNKEKKKLLKYKYINYYTTNFQRPLLFPVNDYKNKYPNFQKYNLREDFYIAEENKDKQKKKKNNIKKNKKKKKKKKLRKKRTKKH